MYTSSLLWSWKSQPNDGLSLPGVGPAIFQSLALFANVVVLSNRPGVGQVRLTTFVIWFIAIRIACMVAHITTSAQQTLALRKSLSCTSPWMCCLMTVRATAVKEGKA
jgi:hypothetical protein